MNDLVALTDRTTEWRRLKALVLDSVSSPITKRVYNIGLDEFISWYTQEPRAGFSKATVAAWRVHLERRGLGSISINVRITAVRKLALEAADNGLLAAEIASGIGRIKGVPTRGVRTGNWRSLAQAQLPLNTPNIATLKGLRDRAIFAVLLGCGLRRSEVAAMTFKQVQQRDNRWCIVELVGKHGRVCTVPMPTWDGNLEVFEPPVAVAKSKASGLDTKQILEMARAQGAASDLTFDVSGARGAEDNERQNAEAAAPRKSEATSSEPKGELHVTSIMPE